MAAPFWESLLPSLGALALSGLAIKERLALALDNRGTTVKADP
jgi:hypothetical protein